MSDASVRIVDPAAREISEASAGLASDWPALPLAAWQDTYATLHMWTQIVGKVRLALAPVQNHWWQVPLYVCPRGLTTSAIPYDGRLFEVTFDFIEHCLTIDASDGTVRTLPLIPKSVATFYREVMDALHDTGIAVKIWPVPVEVPNPIPFPDDHQHAAYDAQDAHRFWRALCHADKVLKQFRGRFIGKCSPVHFFWGSFDLAVTRFSGRRAPERPGADPVTREAYSHEVISHGFWPGGGPVPGAAFYAYAAPEPPGFPQSTPRPAAARYDDSLHEFLLMYDDVRTAASPEQAVLDFCQSTYESAANLANWDRPALERQP